MKKIFLLLITVFLVLAGINGCKTPEEWRKIDAILENDPERGKYFAIWGGKIQVKTDSWEYLMKKIEECPKGETPFIYYRPLKSWREE